MRVVLFERRLLLGTEPKGSERSALGTLVRAHPANKSEPHGRSLAWQQQRAIKALADASDDGLSELHQTGCVGEDGQWLPIS